MSDADIIIKAFFFQYGKPAPKNSEFKSVLNADTLFGGFFHYTARNDAVKDSVNTEEEIMDDGVDEKKNSSFSDYTSRENAVKNSGKDYFTMSNEGRLYTKKQRDAWREKAASSFSKKGDIAWSFVVTFRDYDLLKKYGLHDQNDMSAAASIALRKAFQRMHLNTENMIWWEDYHTNTNHPHMHITFLEKEHSRDRGKLTEKEINAVKTVFFSELAARKAFYEKYNVKAEEALKNITPMRKNVVKDVKKLSYKSIQSIADLYQQLPEKGRLQYNSSFMIPYREKLDAIAEELLNTDEVKPAFEKFRTHVMQLNDNINSTGNADSSSLWDSEYQKLKVQIANSVLAEFKNFKKNGMEKAGDIEPWKAENCSNASAKICADILGSKDSTEAEKITAAALIAGDTGTADEWIVKINNPKTKEFFETVKVFSKPDAGEEEQTKAQENMIVAAQHGNSYCRAAHVSSADRYPLVKSTYRRLESAIRPVFIHHANSSVIRQQIILDQEIDAYLKDINKVTDTVYQDKYTWQRG